MSPKQHGRLGQPDHDHDNLDRYETDTRDGHLPADMTDFQDDMDENYQRTGNYRADHFNKNRFDKNRNMNGFFKFLGCCGER